MALIQRSENLSVHVAEMDGQHRRLIGMINDLSDAMRQGKGKEVLQKTIDALIEYTQTHFVNEEKYFDKFRYPEANSQKKEHTAFVKKVSQFRDGFGKGQIGLSVEIMNFLSDWLKNHIQVSDKKYGPFLNEKGLK